MPVITLSVWILLLTWIQSAFTTAWLFAAISCTNFKRNQRNCKQQFVFINWMDENREKKSDIKSLCQKKSKTKKMPIRVNAIHLPIFNMTKIYFLVNVECTWIQLMFQLLLMANYVKLCDYWIILQSKCEIATKFTLTLCYFVLTY